MVSPARTPQRTAHRRQQILDTARALFEADGIAQVTTGRIAQVAGISPGNLYYWFANKDEIVRALFEEWAADSVLALAPDAPPDQVLRMLWRQEPAQHEISARYGFFARELFPLLHADPALAERYRANVTARVADLSALVEQVVAAGLLVPPAPPTTVPELVAVAWLVAETATPFAQVVGDQVLDPRTAPLAVLAPLLTARGRQVLDLDGPVR